MPKQKFDLNFRLVVISKIISVVGGNVLGFAMILFLVDFTGSAAMLGIITAVSQIPTVFITPFAGMIADRLNKKKLIVCFDFLTAATNFFFLYLLLSQTYTIFNITVLRMVKISIVIFAQTTFGASVPRIVKQEQLIAANGVIQSIAAIGLIAGSVLGGILFGVVSLEMIAFASGVVFLISGTISMFIKIPYTKRKLVGGIFQTVKSDMRESFIFLKNEKPIIFKLALVTAVITLLFPPIFNIGLPFIVGVIFEQQVTLSFGVAAVGMLAGGILAGKLRKFLDIKNLAIWITFLGITGLLLALSFMPWMPNIAFAFWIFNLTLALMLFMFALLGTSVGAFRQQEVPAHLLGKVESLLGMISLVAGPLGVLAVGFFIETIHLPLFFVGLAVLSWGLAFLCSLVLKKYFRKTGVKSNGV